MRYIVTGGCGFIGSNLVKKLAENGNDVIIIDNLSTGSLENIKPCKFEVLKTIGILPELGKEDGLFHLGMPSSSPMYRENRHLVGKIISEFVTVMEWAKENRAKIVYASSSSVYNFNKTPFREDMAIIPTDFYTEVRYSMERIARVYYEFYGVKSVGLRLFSVYGEGEKTKGKYANLVSQIIWAKESGKTFDVYNRGETERDFIHVDDAVRAFLLAMDSNIECDVINVGTGKAYTINSIIKAVGLKNYRYVDNLIKNYVARTLADTEKAEKKLGFKAEKDVMDYIKAKVKT